MTTFTKRNAAFDATRVAVSALPTTDPSAEQHVAVLEAAGTLWSCGVPVNWTKLHGGETRARVPLPTYAFDRKRYWLENEARPAIRSGDEAPVPKAADRVLTVVAQNEARNANDVTAKLGAIFKEALGVARSVRRTGSSISAEIADGPCRDGRDRACIRPAVAGAEPDRRATITSLAETLSVQRRARPRRPISAFRLESGVVLSHPYGGQVMSYLLPSDDDGHPVFGLRGLEGERPRTATLRRLPASMSKR